MWQVKLLTDFVASIERGYTVLGDVGVRVLLSISFRRLVPNHSLFGDGVDPELTRFQLPLVRVVLATCNVRSARLLSEHQIVLRSRHRLKEVRLFLNLFPFAQRLRCQILHFFMEVLIE